MNKALHSAITVCKDCEFRHVGCHGTCAPYLAQKEEQKRLKALYFDGVTREKKNLGHRITEQAARKRR